jgi:hypothetical protein
MPCFQWIRRGTFQHCRPFHTWRGATVLSSTQFFRAAVRRGLGAAAEYSGRGVVSCTHWPSDHPCTLANAGACRFGHHRVTGMHNRTSFTESLMRSSSVRMAMLTSVVAPQLQRLDLGSSDIVRDDAIGWEDADVVRIDRLVPDLCCQVRHETRQPSSHRSAKCRPQRRCVLHMHDGRAGECQGVLRCAIG